MKKDILFILAPPYWEKLPHPGIAYLIEYLNFFNINADFFDLNIKIFNRLTPDYKKDWTLNKNYIKKSFFNFCFEKFKDLFELLVNKIENEGIEFIGFSVLKSNKEFSESLALYLRNRIKNLKIIFGGPETFSMYIQNSLNFEVADYFVIGEGEIPVYKILTEEKSEKIFKFCNLSEINFFPLYKKFHLNLYKKQNSLPIVASRGCINKCKFCSERLLFNTYRFRKPENVFEEIYYFNKFKNINYFVFYDSIFNGNLKNLDYLTELIIKNNLKINWEAQIYVRNDMSLELLKKMKQSGCVNLFIGIESFSDKILKLMNKGFTVNEALSFLEKLNEAGLNFEISLIVNYPGETEEDFDETIKVIEKNKNLIKKIAQISRFRNYPGINVNLPENYNEKISDARIKKILEVLKRNGIKYTKSYIDNLI